MRQRGGVNLRNSRKATPDKALLDAVSRGAAKLLPYDDFSAQKPQLLRVDKSGTILRLKLSPGVFSNSGLSLERPGIGNAKRVDPL